MPMCFNLFGELPHDQDRAQATARFLLPDAPEGPVEVKFEWSPGRGSTDYTRDRTAFDAALWIGEHGGPRAVVGIETKYHEHAVREPRTKAGREERHADQREHYLAIADAAGCFAPGWRDAVLDTDLEQIWRDHLLVLSLSQAGGEWRTGVYVLVHPAGNRSCAQAAARYAECLSETTSFRAVTLEALLDAHVCHRPETEAAFRERYLF